MFGQTVERKDRAQHRHFWRGGGTQVKIHIERMTTYAYKSTQMHIRISRNYIALECAFLFNETLFQRDEVLSADFNMDGSKIISCGMDHRYFFKPRI